MALPILAAAARLAANAAKTQLAQSAKDSVSGFFNDEKGGAFPLVLKGIVAILGLAVLMMLAFAGSTSGNLTGVDNPRESGLTECEPGEPCEPPPATGDCAALVDASGLTYSYPNDEEGVPRGQIERVVGDPPDDPVGELVPVHPGLCNLLIGLVNSNVTVRATAVLDTHTKFVAGSNRISRHWVGAAIDTGNSEAIARYAFVNRTALGIQQIITGQFQQYNVDDGNPVPWSRWSPGVQNQHYNHIHIGW